MIARIAITICCVLACLTSAAILQAEEKDASVSKVMILPFDGGSAGKFSYLTDPIRSMVTSRLAGQEGVEVVDYGLRAGDLEKLSRGETTLEDGGSLFSRYDLDSWIRNGEQVTVDELTTR